MFYTTNSIENATHWMARADEDSVVKDYIIPDKAYELIKQKDPMTDEEEIFIRSEDDNLSMYYMCHAGDFVIEYRKDLN